MTNLIPSFAAGELVVLALLLTLALVLIVGSRRRLDVSVGAAKPDYFAWALAPDLALARELRSTTYPGLYDTRAVGRPDRAPFGGAS